MNLFVCKWPALWNLAKKSSAARGKLLRSADQGYSTSILNTSKEWIYLSVNDLLLWIWIWIRNLQLRAGNCCGLLINLVRRANLQHPAKNHDKNVFFLLTQSYLKRRVLDVSWTGRQAAVRTRKWILVYEWESRAFIAWTWGTLNCSEPSCVIDLKSNQPSK